VVVVSRLLTIIAWLALVTALVMHQPSPRDEPPEWYVQVCAEVATC
jgi:hypothetical protein